MARPIATLELTLDERVELRNRVRAGTTPRRDSLRARIIWLRAQGIKVEQVARRLGVSVTSVCKWSGRFETLGLEGLKDAPGRGRKPSLPPEKVEQVPVRVTQPPKGHTRWSVRSMAKAVGISHDSVHRIWKNNDLKPHLTRTFKLSRDPQFEPKFWDVIGLYLNPPAKALVVTQIFREHCSLELVALSFEPDPTCWAEQQWRGAVLGDARRNRRAVLLGAALASRPDAGLPEQTGSWRDLKPAYRLLNEPDVTHRALSEPHWQATRRLAEQADTVLFVQDTSELDFTTRRRTAGLGMIGDTVGRGFILHSCLAVRPGPIPEILGLAAQRVWTRQEIKKGRETRAQRALRPKESDVWAEIVEEIGPAPADPRQCWVSVGDRASDIFSFLQRAQAGNWRCLWRVSQNRRILTPGGKQAKLLDWVRRLPSQTETTLELRGRQGRPGRTIRLQVAWSKITFCPPRNGPDRKQAAVPGWCVRCWEARKKNALEWVLFTTVPVTDAASACERIAWYRLRWLIEEYHKALKTGCSMERRQLQSAQGLPALLGFLAIVAVRLLQLRATARVAPDTPASHIVEPELVNTINRFRAKPDAKLTVEQFWRAVAGLGGFLGRKGDGNPGWQTLWRGWLRLEDLCWGASQAPFPPIKSG